MKRFELHNLNAHTFTYTPATPTAFTVTRKNPGTHTERAPSLAEIQVPNAATAQIEAGAAEPLTLYPGDIVECPDDCEAFDALVHAGAAQELP